VNAISVALTLWEKGFISDDTVIDWAYSEIIKADVPSLEMIDLALYGPLPCVRQSRHDFPSKPFELSYQDEFVLRTMRCDFASNEDVFQFVTWVSRYSLGEDFSCELVAFGYQLDHLISDCDNMPAAMSWARENISQVAAHFTNDVPAMLEQVPMLRSVLRPQFPVQ
jgi:hypothetical protein